MNILRACRSSTLVHKRNLSECGLPKKTPQHLICFKQWSTDMVMAVLSSAIELKYRVKSGKAETLSSLLIGSKIMTIQEVNQPILSMAVSKAASMLGANDVTIIDKIMWDHDYNGKLFSYMADAMFVSTDSHTCLQRFADQAHVPVLCIRSRTHATIQALATTMAILEHYGDFRNLNIAWLGPAHQVLNSYLLLCPMLGANIKFKCCCDITPVSPLLKKASEGICESSQTVVTECTKREDVIMNSHVVIAGPTTMKPDKLEFFKISLKDMDKMACKDWTFFHTCPRGKEVGDDLFYHAQAKTYNAFENLPFLVGALMAYVIKGCLFM